MKRVLLISALAALVACDADLGADEGGVDAIDGVDMIRHVGVLAADEMRGRAPGSAGEDKTVEYLVEQFSAAGMQPGNGDSWTQDVPLVRITASPSMAMRIHPTTAQRTAEFQQTGAAPAADNGEKAQSQANAQGQEQAATKAEADEQGEQQQPGYQFEYGDEMVAFTRRLQQQVNVDNSELVFAGYGIVAPEYNWNDYEGLDVEGKTVVVLVNDPGFATQDPELFNGNAMTYYGRWSYKYEEAARQGATGAIIVHETDAAGYPWEVVTGSWSGEQFDLAGDSGEYRLPMRAWITHEAAQRLFKESGMDYAALKERALQPEFQAQPLGQAVSITIMNQIEEITSKNVIAALPGDSRAEETIIYTAHWDHLGVDDSRTDDPVFNGAVDNATGVAGLLELAEAFGTLEDRPERTVVFLAVTAEESGLLGSKWYAENPVYPLGETVAVINIDSMNVYGPTSDVVVVGHGNSELEEYLARAAEEQGREIVPEEHPERGYYYRSDHFNFAKMGVPALYAESGSSYIGENAEEAAERSAAYTADHYHKPSDEYGDWWNLEGAVQDLHLYYNVGKELADSDVFPNWFEGNEFRAVREESAALRQSE